ncbi:MAG: cysteine desulfurase family protein [Simkaniaceae bacterium]|nr:cysteine desulfurase family protein [Simkaniaceae bacterium]
MKKTIYLDNNATTPLDPDVLAAMIKELSASPNNPSSSHYFGQRARKTLGRCRHIIAKFLNVKLDEILFTSGGTEGMNFLIRGALSDLSCHVIASPIDHACVFNTLEELKQKGTAVTYLPIDFYGAPKVEDLQRAIRPNTRLIVLSAVNSETGIKLDMEAIAEVAKRTNVPLILDGVALLGKESFSIPEGVAAMAFSAHKFHGPPGVGFVFVRSGLKLSPLLTGGGQEKTLRSGTQNLPGIVGMTKALETINKDEGFAYVRSLRDQFEKQLESQVFDVEVNGKGPRISNTSNLYFPRIDGETLSIYLDMHHVAASRTSACASGAVELSRTLINMGYREERASSSIRFSFSRMNTPEDIQRTTHLIKSLTQSLETS